MTGYHTVASLRHLAREMSMSEINNEDLMFLEKYRDSLDEATETKDEEYEGTDPSEAFETTRTLENLSVTTIESTCLSHKDKVKIDELLQFLSNWI